LNFFGARPHFFDSWRDLEIESHTAIYKKSRFNGFLIYWIASFIADLFWQGRRWVRFGIVQFRAQKTVGDKINYKE
jgi:hypothetical protein